MTFCVREGDKTLNIYSNNYGKIQIIINQDKEKLPQYSASIEINKFQAKRLGEWLINETII